MKTPLTHANCVSIFRLTAVIGLLIFPRLGLCQSPIFCGEKIASTITNATEIDQYSLSGTAGEVISVAFNWGCGDAGQVDVYYPGAFYPSNSITVGCDGTETNLTLPSTGTYYLYVHESGFSGVGSYELSIQTPVTGGCNATPIVCGQKVATNFSYAAEMDAYDYAGTAGQVISLAFNWGCGDSGNVDIYYPGATTPSKTITVGCNGIETNLMLPSDGNYTFIVHESSYYGIGSYELSIQTPVTGGCNATPIICGQKVATNFSYAAEMDAYDYAGSAGQVISLAFNWGCGDSGNVDIYYPGATTPSETITVGCNGIETNLMLPSDGNYTFIVHESTYYGTGSYELSIQTPVTGGCNATPIACGQTVVTNFSYAAEMDAYDYVGTAGQTILLAFDWGCGDSGNVDIYYPGAITPSKTISVGCTGIETNLTLPSDGNYTFIVHESTYYGIGSYELSIQTDTGGGCDSMPIACGETVSTNTRYAAEMDAYGFGTGGGGVIFSFTGYAGARFDLYDATGSKVLTASPGTGTNLTLADGTYTLLVHDVNYYATGNYGFSVTCFPQCSYSINPTGPISVGATATNGTVSVTAGSGCAWTATTNVSWLRITNIVNGTGDGAVEYSVDSNTNGAARVGTMTIAGWTFIVNQASPVVFAGVNVGDPGTNGSFSYSNTIYTVSGSGEGTDGTADVFYYLYQTLSGDSQIIARLTGLQGGDPNLAEAGVMIRQSLDPGAEQVSLSLNGSTNVIFRRRLAPDAFGVNNSFQGSNYLSGNNYIWLRLMRMSNTFVAHYSTNGTDWQYMWFTTVPMTNQVYVGLEVTAHHFGELATATFDNVSTGSLTPLSGVWPLPDPLLLLGGQNWTPAEFQRVGGYEFLLGGVVGDYFSINSSTNLAAPFASWPSLGTVTNTYGIVPIIDAQSISNNSLFYRAEKLGGP